MLDHHLHRERRDGVALLGANRPDGTPVRIQIFGDELWAYATSTSNWYSGTQLLMTEIHFVYQPTGEIFDIRLEDYMPQSVFFMTGLREPIPALSLIHISEP